MWQIKQSACYLYLILWQIKRGISYSHLILRQIKRDASLNFVSILQIAEDAQHPIQHSYKAHGAGEDSWTAKEMLRSSHLVLNWHYDVNTFHGEDCCTVSEILF